MNTFCAQMFYRLPDALEGMLGYSLWLSSLVSHPQRSSLKMGLQHSQTQTESLEPSAFRPRASAGSGAIFLFNMVGLVAFCQKMNKYVHFIWFWTIFVLYTLHSHKRRSCDYLVYFHHRLWWFRERHCHGGYIIWLVVDTSTTDTAEEVVGMCSRCPFVAWCTCWFVC